MRSSELADVTDGGFVPADCGVVQGGRSSWIISLQRGGVLKKGRFHTATRKAEIGRSRWDK